MRLYWYYFSLWINCVEWKSLKFGVLRRKIWIEAWHDLLESSTLLISSRLKTERAFCFFSKYSWHWMHVHVLNPGNVETRWCLLYKPFFFFLLIGFWSKSQSERFQRYLMGSASKNIWSLLCAYNIKTLPEVPTSE